MNTNDLIAAVRHNLRIRHPRFIDVSFVPRGYVKREDHVVIYGSWFNERYSIFCSDKEDSLKVADLDLWHIIKE